MHDNNLLAVKSLMVKNHYGVMILLKLDCRGGGGGGVVGKVGVKKNSVAVLNNSSVPLSYAFW